MIVTEHALQRAQQRYGLVNIDRQVIAADVCEALKERRGSRLHPDGTGFEAKRGTIYVWTANGRRLYIVEAFRWKGKTKLRVLTALPGNRRETSCLSPPHQLAA